MIYASRSERLDWLISRLIEDVPQAQGIRIPADITDKKRLFRALMNVREPKPVTTEFLSAQDEELQYQLEEKSVVNLDGEGIEIWQGDITRLKVDAIVNAANSRMLGCFIPLHGCIDNAIHSAAGVQLRLECAEVMKGQGYEEPTGMAKITNGYNLPSKYVIHTVGPIIYGDTPNDTEQRLLADSYRNCLSLAEKQGLRSIAFCCISTGEFHFPNELAAKIAVDEVKTFMSKAQNIKHVIFNVFKDVDKDIYKKLLQQNIVSE